MSKLTFGLNTSTIRPAGPREKIEITAKAGYEAIEMWISDVDQYVKDGGTIADLRKLLDDLSLARPSMIMLGGFYTVDESSLALAMDECKRRLDIAAQLGIKRIVASPPREKVNRALAIERYGMLLDVSLTFGVPASVEFLGFVEGINTLEEAWAICSGPGNSAATVTPDIWHLFRGGSNLATLDQIPADHISCFHWNDAPREPARLEQNDSHRVYPGDGIMPLAQIADQLRKKGWEGCLTLELFNPEYWKEDPLVVAKTGLEKMKASVGVKA
ncbi:sugar phosphate isomerase/epimerase [bacterium]|nr:sugar phosphate isomerase/epimerase [bacterium]